MELHFERLLDCLGKRIDDHELRQLLGNPPREIQRFAYTGFAECKDLGVSVVFKQAPWVVPSEQITEPNALHVWAFGFHRQGHGGYAQYAGLFPGGVMFGDSENDVRNKLGKPMAAGGGGFSTGLKKPRQRWLRYPLRNAVLRFQFDPDGLVDLVTLYLTDPPEDQDTSLSA